MKKIIVALVLVNSITATKINAQSTSYFYGNNFSQTTICENPGSPWQDYVTTESFSTPVGTNAIHFVQYNHGGLILLDAYLNEFGIDARNVDITPVATNMFLHTSYYRDIVNSPTTVSIRVALLRIVGPNLVVMAQNVINSTHPTLNSLYAMDATLDNNTGGFVICGMAVEDLNDGPTAQKEAFVVTLTPGLNPIFMRFYNSNSGGSEDYDIATRVVVTGSGRYYVAGSENGQKLLPYYHRMVVRNMLIEPATLSYTLPGTWRVPITILSDNSENSVDMVEVNGMFVTLVNNNQDFQTGIIHVNPANGTFLFPQYQEILGFGINYGHSIVRGNSPGEIIVHGMEYNQPGLCTDAIISPFHASPYYASVNAGGYPSPLLVKTQYITRVGNSTWPFPGTPDYWTDGGLYSTLNGYPLPMFRGKFAQRSGPDFAVIAPIYSPTPLLNDKFIFTTGGGTTLCPTINCGDMQLHFDNMYPNTSLNDIDYFPNASLCDIIIQPISHYGSDNCFNGYFRTTQESGNEISNVSLHLSQTLIYPNPSSTVLNIELADNYTGNVNITLYDVTGKKVAEVFNGLKTEKISYVLPLTLTNGVYYLQIASDGQQPKTEKINVMR